ncbi:flagellar protein FlaG [Thermanaeromonas toyohensis ToBE]|uniref:Flagellar protein FlaG n=1 Tax=Thermanaeromonas toyohensis ToBE TaxID=698762 RepID=A0A1W1VKN6_9FIRM|nr:flagellar protein FlaG [Thermanaeromonas toyohensis]SMB93939.1 flagellar protein FlaG [Thermanaeromonas toyohensis ToBE]
MRVEGVDPLILNQVQVQLQKPLVPDTKEVNILTDKDRENSQGQEFAREHLEHSIAKLNAAAELFNIELRFKVDYEKGEIYVLVIDITQGKVIRRIPPENALKIANQMQQLVGLLLDVLI